MPYVKHKKWLDINFEQFVKYYETHSRIETMNFFNLTLAEFKALCKYNNYRKPKHLTIIHQQKTNLLKYGCICSLQNKTIKLKANQTKLELYGDIYYNNKKQAKQTCTEKYGVDCPLKVQEIKDKIKATNILRYGAENVFSNKDIQYKAQQTLMQKYGVPHAMQNKNLFKKSCKHYTYNNIGFDSSVEVALWIYAVDHNEPIVREPVQFEYQVNNETYFYFPDFLYKNKLIEIKGLQFFENKDINSKMINPYDHTKDAKAEAKHQCILAHNVEIWTEKDYKFVLDYINQIYGKDYLKQFKNI